MMNIDLVRESLNKLLDEENMSQWEQDFSGSILEQLDENRTLSLNQEEKVSQIILKYDQ